MANGHNESSRRTAGAEQSHHGGMAVEGQVIVGNTMLAGGGGEHNQLTGRQQVWQRDKRHNRRITMACQRGYVRHNIPRHVCVRKSPVTSMNNRHNS